MWYVESNILFIGDGLVEHDLVYWYGVGVIPSLMFKTIEHGNSYYVQSSKETNVYSKPTKRCDMLACVSNRFAFSLASLIVSFAVIGKLLSFSFSTIIYRNLQKRITSLHIYTYHFYFPCSI